MMSLTAIAMGIYAVELPQYFRRYMFRLLVAFLFITFIYDIDDLFFIHDSNADAEADGGVQSNVRLFSKLFTYLSLLFRPIVIVVFWKVPTLSRFGFAQVRVGSAEVSALFLLERGWGDALCAQTGVAMSLGVALECMMLGAYG